ncbi:ribosomal protein S7 [Perkinsela sp. CCAP 1560/4]|nr:ribosomal protein S7 [Perkinsela sp. CCAP 1560/4]|eukprot:KNH07797.1 ribosomal protein S7 [Perkinsela sp. CCAP 1560/4]
MSIAAHRRKLRKSNRKNPSPLDEEISRAVYDIELTSPKLKTALSALHFNTAKEFDIGRSRRCVVVFYPLRFLRKMHKIQSLLSSELEKKFSGKQFVFISQRKIRQRPKNIYKIQDVPRSHTMSSVHDAMLDDLVYPADVVSRRTRYLIDGSQQHKVYLHLKEKERVEHRVDAYAVVYKRLTGKETVFGFMSNPALQQVAA